MPTTRFVNRTTELKVLDDWWNQSGAGMAAVWGRKRVGKTWLIDHFAKGRRSVRHICRARPHAEELVALSGKTAGVVKTPRRSLGERPFRSWQDALDVFAHAAESEPLLVVLDEFPELLRAVPRFDVELRALWDEVVLGAPTNLKLILCGSAVGSMEALQAESAPLHGRVSQRLLVRPFRPHEAALMLGNLDPPARAQAWGVCGGIPRLLALWDDRADLRENLRRLVCSEQGVLLSEGDLILGDEDIVGHRREHLPEQILRAVATGSTSFSEIHSKVSGLPTRSLEYLTDVRLLERVVPVTQDPARTKLSYYRIVDNFLAFWLRCVEPHREQIESGLGATVLNVVMKEFSDFMGARYEHAFREHLRRLAANGRFGEEVIAVGEWWRAQSGPASDPCQLDGVVLAGRKRTPVVVGEAKWANVVNGSSEAGGMKRKLLESGLADPETVIFVVAGREEVRRSSAVLGVTASDIFS